MRALESALLIVFAIGYLCLATMRRYRTATAHIPSGSANAGTGR